MLFLLQQGTQEREQDQDFEPNGGEALSRTSSLTNSEYQEDHQPYPEGIEVDGGIDEEDQKVLENMLNDLQEVTTVRFLV